MKYFLQVCFLMIYEILYGFFFFKLNFVCKGSQPRGVYADLLRFQSRVEDSIHIILMKSMNPFFIPSFHVLFMNKENQRVICNISDKNIERFLFASV